MNSLSLLRVMLLRYFAPALSVDVSPPVRSSKPPRFSVRFVGHEPCILQQKFITPPRPIIRAGARCDPFRLLPPFLFRWPTPPARSCRRMQNRRVPSLAFREPKNGLDSHHLHRLTTSTTTSVISPSVRLRFVSILLFPTLPCSCGPLLILRQA